MLVSRFVKIPLLLDASEMSELMGDLQIFEIGRLTENPKGNFLESYTQYVEALKRGEKCEWSRAFVWTSTLDAVEIRKIDHRYLVKPKLPIIQLQPSRVRYSPLDGEFQTAVYGKDSISWGVQLSYPFLFQDEKTHAIEKITPCDKFPNTAPFLKVQKWIRHHTKATPFVVDGKKVNVPIRLGKKCFEWIANHPD